MSFQSSIEAFNKKALLKASKNTSNIAEDLMSRIVTSTPSPSNPGKYADGLLVNQWYPQIGGYSSAISGATNDYGAASLSRIKSTLATNPFLGKDAVLTFTNNVHYARQAEEIGWARTPAYHMVRLSVAYVKGAYS